MAEIRCPVEVLHRSESGVQEFDAPHTPTSYAREIARYIACPSTVRARTLDEFGRAPPLDKIRAMRAFHVEARASYRRAADGMGEELVDRTDFRVRSLIRPRSLPTPQRPIVTIDVAPVPLSAPDGQWSLPAYAPEIIATIAREFGFTYADMIGPRRTRKMARARRACAYILNVRGSSYAQIGRWLGGRDHSTIIHACRAFVIYATEAERRLAERFIEARRGA